MKTLLKYILLIPKATLKDVKGVAQGYWRYLGYWVYSFYKKNCINKWKEVKAKYEKSPFAEVQEVDDFEELNYLPKHVGEQIRYRLSTMDKTCILKGECPCQCLVPYKQFEDRSCEQNCYPNIMEEKEWKQWKKDNSISDEQIKNGFTRYYSIKNS